MARLNFRFALLVAFLVVFVGHGLVTDAKPIEKKEAEEKDAKEATTEVAPKEEEAADDAADEASEEDAGEEDASTQSKSHKLKSAAQKKCKKGINKNCGKREFRIQGALRPFSHNPGHRVDHENEGEEDEEEPDEKEEGEGHEEPEETPEDRGYDEDTQRNVMAQDGGPSEDLEGAFSHSASTVPEKNAKDPHVETSNIKLKDDEERIEQDIINQEAEPEQRDNNKPEEILQNPSPEQRRAANTENSPESAERVPAALPHSDDGNAIDPAVAAAAAVKTDKEAAAAAADASEKTAAATQGEAETTNPADTKSTTSADVHEDGEMREINEGNYDHHCSDCPFEHEQIMQVSHGSHKGFLHGHGTYGHGCGCDHGGGCDQGCGCGCGCEHGALGPSGTRIGCGCAPAGHLATYVTDTKNTPACPNLNCANICGNVNLGLPHPCCQNSKAQDANKMEAEKAYCPSCKLVNINGNIGLSLPHPCLQLSDDQKCNCGAAGTCGGHCGGCGCGICGSCGCDRICASGRAVVAPATAKAAEAQKDNSTLTTPAATEAEKGSSTATASGEEPSETTDSKIQKLKDSVAKVDEAKGESSGGEVKHPEKRSDGESEEGNLPLDAHNAGMKRKVAKKGENCCRRDGFHPIPPCVFPHGHGHELPIVGVALQGVDCFEGGDLHRVVPHPDEQFSGHFYPGCSHHRNGCADVHNGLPHQVQKELNRGCDCHHGHRAMLNNTGIACCHGHFCSHSDHHYSPYIGNAGVSCCHNGHQCCITGSGCHQGCHHSCHDGCHEVFHHGCHDCYHGGCHGDHHGCHNDHLCGHNDCHGCCLNHEHCLDIMMHATG